MLAAIEVVVAFSCGASERPKRKVKMDMSIDPRFPGFEARRIGVTGAEINLRIGGEGPPLLLLHGYPETHLMWHHLAPRLAEEFTVVATDLRGYGDSSKPESDAAHFPYSKRAMALDQVEVMEALGFKRFRLAAHDRGARVAHRLALDHGERLERLSLLDIVPTRDVYGSVDRPVASAYFHWFFLIQKFDMPERTIGGDPEAFIMHLMNSSVGGRAKEVFGQAVLEDYVRCFSVPDAIHASCEDYRAGASIDLEHDEADLASKISCPTQILWGEKGLVGLRYDVMTLWQDRADDVIGEAVPGTGHFLTEEAPDATYNALVHFLRG